MERKIKGVVSPYIHKESDIEKRLNELEAKVAAIEEALTIHQFLSVADLANAKQVYTYMENEDND